MRTDLRVPVSTRAAALAACALFSTLSPECALAQTPQPDNFNPGANNRVYSLAVQVDGEILAGGDFTMLGGLARRGIARLNVDGTVDNGFNPGVGIGAGGYGVRSLAVRADGKILVGGGFVALGGKHDYLGRLKPDGTADSEFNPRLVTASAFDIGVSCLAAQDDGKILVGGNFTRVWTAPFDYIGRLNEDGTVDTGFYAWAHGPVDSLTAQADGKILVGGDFSRPQDWSYNYIRRVNADGTVDGGFTSQADCGLPAGCGVSSLAVQADGKILAGGSFDILGGQLRQSIGRLEPDGTADIGFNPGASGSYPCYVSSLAVQADGKILLGGNFTSLGGQPRTNIARLNADGSVDGEFNPGANGEVSSLALQADGKILVGGSFTTLGGQARANIARLNNTAPATQTLSFDGSTITWLRGGTGPEVWRTTFELSTDLLMWPSLGAGTRVAGGWQLAVASSPLSGVIRARGYVTGGGSGSGWFVESQVQFTNAVPTIVEDAHSVTNLPGTTATFSITPAGTPPLSIQWRFNGSNLADGNRIAGTRTRSLTITNVQSEDAGTYTAVVSNPWGSVTGKPAMLRVWRVEPLTLLVSPNQTPTSCNFTNVDWVAITLAADFPNPLIFYTLDGSEPSPTSGYYTGALAVSNTVILRAIAYNPVDFSSVKMVPVAINLWTAFRMVATATTGGAVALEPPGGSYLSNTVVTVTALPEVGWELVSWSGDASGASTNLSVVMDRDKSVTAQFGPAPVFTLTAMTAGGGAISGHTQTNYFRGTVINLRTEPESGWTFLNWMGDASGTDRQASLTMDRPKEVQAVFGTECKSTVLGQGTVTRTSGSGLVPYGTVVRLTAIPDPGYYFALWGNAASSVVNPLDFTVTDATPTVGAFFVPLGANQATLTVLEDGAGSVARDPLVNVYTKGQVVRLTAQPFPGQDFLGWSGDASGKQNPLTVTVSASQTITATFSHRLALAIHPWPEAAPHRGFRFVLAGGEGDTCVVETSPDLVDWKPLTTLTFSNTAGQFIDLAVTNRSPRFYRGLVR